MSWSLLIDWIQDQSHGAGERLPLRLFADQLFPPERREAIVAGALAFVGQLPGGRNPAPRLEPMDGRVQRTGLDLQQVFGGPLNVFCDGVPVTGSCQQRPEDQQVERALQELDA